MWSDNETNIDFLNYSETAELVSSTLQQKSIRPVSLGLFGGWGVGKSSLMRMVIDDISADKKNLILQFDAWLFQDYDDARAALLQKIGDTLHAKAKDDEALLKKVKCLFKRIDTLRVLGLVAEGVTFAAGAPTFGVIARGIEGARDIVSGNGNKENFNAVTAMASDAKSKATELSKPEEEESPPRQIEAFRIELKQILEDLDCTLLVFIDNLDRCLPDKAIHTLEAVRLFLFMERTAFVIAADEDMIRLAVAQHYKANLDRLVTDYLDKFVQIPVRVPPTGVSEMKAFLILLLTAEPAYPAQRMRPKLTSALQKFLMSRLQTIWKSPFPETPEILEGLKDAAPTESEKVLISQVSQLSKLISPILVNSPRVKGNPRIVKRMLNTLRMRQMIAARRGINLSEEAMLKLVLFERCAGGKATGDLMNLIGNSNEGKVSLLSQLEGDKEIADPALFPESWREQEEFISEWSKLAPTLGDKDLRPAAYLYRETQPVFTPSAGLSVEAERAVAVLIKATRESASSTDKAVLALAKDEMPQAMEELIRKMSNAISWTKRPEGWPGALAVAGANAEAAKAFVTFIRSRNLSPLPAWMKAALKDRPWWEE